MKYKSKIILISGISFIIAILSVSSIFYSLYYEQINTLEMENNVLPIDKIIDHLVNGKELPPKTIGITIDDAFKSIYKKAWPRLKAAGLPFTVFVSTGPIDANSKNYMNWNEIKNLRDSGVLIGHHTVRHMHLVNQDDETIDGEIENATNSF